MSWAKPCARWQVPTWLNSSTDRVRDCETTPGASIRMRWTVPHSLGSRASWAARKLTAAPPLGPTSTTWGRLL
jgi:hypothetical protein